MVFVIIRHKIEDFDKWKAGFDAHEELRKEAGEIGGDVFRGIEDTSTIIGVFEFEDSDKAKAFFQSEELMAKMKEAGVTDKPDIYFTEKV